MGRMDGAEFSRREVGGVKSPAGCRDNGGQHFVRGRSLTVRDWFLGLASIMRRPNLFIWDLVKFLGFTHAQI